MFKKENMKKKNSAVQWMVTFERANERERAFLLLF